MPIVSELQRDRVALLLTLNVLVFVGYAVTVVMLVAAPSVWFVSFLIVGLAYNVVELCQSSPYRQPPDVVGLRARSNTKPAVTVALPKLSRADRTDPATLLRQRADQCGDMSARLEFSVQCSVH